MACPDGQYFCNDRQKCMPIPKGKRVRKDGELVSEVAPPGWGHTKAEKEKTDPSKPKSKIGGSAAAFDRARKEGRFKGSKADMFKLMWWMKNKGGKPKGKPHYKPGTEEKYKKYQEEYKDPIHYALETDKKIMKLLDKDKKKKKKKYEESTSMKNVDPKDRKVIRSRQKNLFKKDLTGEHQGINELNTKEYKKLNRASVGMMSSDPKVQDKARERQTEIDYKDLLSQIKKKRVKQGKSMKEEAKDQSNKQLDRGMKTTQKAMGVIDNSSYGGLSDDKIDRMNKRLKNRRKDVSGEKISRLTKSLGEGKCADCKCPGCGPNGVGHQNPCVKCGGHHKDKLSERLETFRGSHAERRKNELEDNIKRSNARMKYGKVAGDPDSRIGRKTYDKWKSDVKASSAKNKLRPGEVKRYDNVHQKWVSNKN